MSELERFADSEWAAATRERIDDRMRMLYWAEKLLPELDAVLAGAAKLQRRQGQAEVGRGGQGLVGADLVG